MSTEKSFLLSVFKKCSVPWKQPDRSKWIETIEQVQPFDYNVQTYYLCQLHFSPDDIVERGNKKSIVPGRLPTIFGINNNNTDNTEECSDSNYICETLNDIKSTNLNPIVDISSNSEPLSRYIPSADESFNQNNSSLSIAYDAYV